MTWEHEIRCLYRGPTVAISDFRCRACDSTVGPEEWSGSHDIVFPRTGAFVRHLGRKRTLADPNQVLFFNRGEAYRVSHPVPGGDECTIFTARSDVLLDALARVDPSVRDRPERPFATDAATSSSRTFLSQRQVAAIAGSNRCEAMAVEEATLELLDATVCDVYRAHSTPRNASRPDTMRVHREQAESVKAYVSSHSHEPLSLDGIARAVHSSPYHLARVFRVQTGIPIHRYVTRLRLRAAVERLVDGEPDLTRLALDLGFASHSHFSDAFRREFGVSPSALRRAVRAPCRPRNSPLR